ncbi:unnamed protein product, partial [Amoebophrya sp. A25]
VSRELTSTLRHTAHVQGLHMAADGYVTVGTILSLDLYAGLKLPRSTAEQD